MLACWQGLVRLVILHQAAKGPTYGGRLRKSLHQQGYAISPGSLYPMLHALERAGVLTSHIKIFRGRARKYYDLTQSGRLLLNDLRRKLSPLVSDILADPLPVTTALSETQ